MYRLGSWARQLGDARFLNSDRVQNVLDIPAEQKLKYVLGVICTAQINTDDPEIDLYVMHGLCLHEFENESR